MLKTLALLVLPHLFLAGLAQVDDRFARQVLRLPSLSCQELLKPDPLLHFRKFIAGLKRAFKQKKLRFPGSVKRLADRKAFDALLRRLLRHDLVVYAKRLLHGVFDRHRPDRVLHL
jgi:hypothetical protein